MNDDTYTPCTKCGRPMAYCKGQCCGKAKGCDCQEYGPMVSGCIREVKPGCPYKAVIPTLTVEDKSNLKDLADCFVHVSNINTTFYIDDKHRTIVTWAGPVEYDNYNLDTNTLGLRSQFLIDHANDYAAYYNKTGEYQKFNFSEGGADEPIRLTMNYSTDSADWETGGLAPVLDGSAPDRAVVNLTGDPSKTTFTNQSTAEVMSVDDLVTMLDNGANVVLDNVPLGATFNANTGLYEFNTVVDGISLSNKTTQTTGADTSITTYSGSAQVFVYMPPVMAATNLGIFVVKMPNSDSSVMIQGFQLENIN